MRRRPRRFVPAALWLLVPLACLACSKVPFLSGNGNGDEGDGGACPARRAAPAILPGVTAEQRTLDYWLSNGERLDEVILSPQEIADHNDAFRALAARSPGDDPLTFFELGEPEDEKRLGDEIRARLAYMRERLEDGRYLDEEGNKLDDDARRAFAEPGSLPRIGSELRVALAAISLRCGPEDAPIYSGPEVDKRFDRNGCSTLRAQEPLRVIASWPAGMKLVRSRYALGWIDEDAALSPPVPGDQVARILGAERLLLRGKIRLQGGGAEIELEDKTLVAHAGGDRALFASADGFHVSEPLPKDRAERAPRPLTRRALLTEAFGYLDTPYGWGGQKGGRDCSRFVMDVMASFGLELPRHSGLQAQAGSMGIDVEKLGTAERLALIDAAHRQGVVLLHFPGHIMLYLGRDDRDRPMVMHAFAEYLEACKPEDAKTAGRDETLYTVDRVQVSDLSLGKDTSRKSFLERLTGLSLLGREPGQGLLGLAARRPAAPLGDAPKRCEDSEAVTMLVSPRTPHPGAPLRVVVSSARDLGSVAIALDGPGGRRLAPPVHALGGPPFGYWVELSSPEVGAWTATVGEGGRGEACRRFTVHERGEVRQGAGGRVWVPKRKWSRGSENLFSTFVEQLFDHPFDDRTWPNLSKLIEDRDRNILYGHLGQNEEVGMHLEPDCADLPYFLRAYFAWKLRLPFAYRHCNRGRSGKAPYCDRDLHDHLVAPEGKDEVAGFRDFVRRRVGDGVHSGTGRTAPGDDDTDYYPVPLTREAIRPGILYADPYGHLFVIADWIPQGPNGRGILIGADAQPDGTVGRRRFWRGAFLFTPDTTEAGAGFKAFRPLVYRGGRIRSVDNKDIGAMDGMAPFSLEQYQGNKDDFYDKVEALIHPRPLDPKQALAVLIDALHEQVKRRVVSVQNGEDYKRDHRGSIDMPEGHAIFETTGAWEDYSTPARDMRLLIAVDTVTGFTDVVARRPERYGIDEGVEPAVAELRRHLDGELDKRRFAYVKSDGGRVELRLADVIARIKDFEMAYNPNDCVEIRWAAPEGSDERASCRTRAPAGQIRRMESYRSWFATRTRPAR